MLKIQQHKCIYNRPYIFLYVKDKKSIRCDPSSNKKKKKKKKILVKSIPIDFYTEGKTKFENPVFNVFIVEKLILKQANNPLEWI